MLKFKSLSFLAHPTSSPAVPEVPGALQAASPSPEEDEGIQGSEEGWNWPDTDPHQHKCEGQEADVKATDQKSHNQ